MKNERKEKLKKEMLDLKKSFVSGALELTSGINALLNSKQVMCILNINSETTLIKYEREGLITPTTRIGNRKRYSVKSIKKFIGE